MKNKSKLLEEMRLHKKIVNEILLSEEAIKTIQYHFSLPDNYNTLKTRKREYVYARQIAMFIIKKHTNFSLEKIGDDLFGNRDHATVLHALKTIKNLMDTSKSIKEEVINLEKLILHKSNSTSQKQNIDKDYYYVDFNDYASVRFSDKKGIILTGFSKEEIYNLISLLEVSKYEIKFHINTGQYILEKIENDSNT